MFLSFLKQLLLDSGHEICPGICSYPSDLRFKTKHLHEWGKAFILVVVCSGTFQTITNSYQLIHCKQLHHDINQLAKWSATVSDAQKQARTMTSSNYGLKFLFIKELNKTRMQSESFVNMVTRC